MPVDDKPDELYEARRKIECDDVEFQIIREWEIEIRINHFSMEKDANRTGGEQPGRIKVIYKDNMGFQIRVPEIWNAVL